MLAQGSALKEANARADAAQKQVLRLEAQVGLCTRGHTASQPALSCGDLTCVQLCILVPLDAATAAGLPQPHWPCACCLLGTLITSETQ